MSLQVGSIYMTSIGDLDNPIMGAVLRRMWWKPWRYSVQPLYYSHRGTNIQGNTIYHLPVGEIHETREGETIYNLTKLGAIGVMKLMGVTHKDFDDFSGESK